MIKSAFSINYSSRDRTLYLDGSLFEGWGSAKRVLWNLPLDLQRKLLQGQLTKLAVSDAAPSYSEPLKRYGEFAYSYWNDTDDWQARAARYHFVEASSVWRTRLAHALSASYCSDKALVALAEIAPSLQVRIPQSAASSIPVSVLPFTENFEPSQSLIQHALQLPAFLFDLTYPFAGGSYTPATFQSGAPNRSALLLRGENTERWQHVQKALQSLVPPEAVATGPRRRFGDNEERLARCLVAPGEICIWKGRATQPAEIYIYGHGEPGTAFDDSFRVDLSFNPLNNPWQWMAPVIERAAKSKVGGYLKALYVTPETLGKALEGVPNSQQNAGSIIIFSSCWAGGGVGSGSMMPNYLVSRGYKIVAPHTPVREDFAVRFAAALRYFLSACSTPSRAVLASRWKTLIAGDPSGLVYQGFGF